MHDPLAQDAALAVLGDKVVGASSLEVGGARVRPADRRHRLARVQGDRSGLVQAQRPDASRSSTYGAPCRPTSSMTWPTCSISARGAKKPRPAYSAMVSRRWEPIGVAVVGTTILLSLIVWLDNVHIATLNGMYKSIQLEAWIHTPATARLDPSNYIYFPVYGVLCRSSIGSACFVASPRSKSRY